MTTVIREPVDKATERARRAHGPEGGGGDAAGDIRGRSRARPETGDSAFEGVDHQNIRPLEQVCG